MIRVNPISKLVNVLKSFWRVGKCIMRGGFDLSKR